MNSIYTVVIPPWTCWEQKILTILGERFNAQPKKGGFFLGIAYALPYSGVIFLYAPLSILQGIYAKYYGLTLTSIAAVLLFARIFDAVTDPLIGYYSDRYHARKGTRKPFIVAGGLLMVVAGYFLYAPPPQLTVTYFSIWSILFYLGLTLFEIPHLSWAGELATESHEKTKIFSFRTAAGYLGLVLFYMIPLSPFFETSDITPETLRWSAISAGVLLCPTLYYCIRTVPSVRSIPSGEQKSSLSYSRGKKNRKLLFQAIAKNKPFLIFLGVYIFYGLGVGLWNGLIFIFVDSYLKLGDQFAQMFLVAFIISIAVTPLWCLLAGRFGKKEVWIVALLLVMASFIYTGFLKPNQTTVIELMSLKVINTLGFVCITIIAPSILSDIVDYSSWKIRTNLSATYFSSYLFFTKCLAAVGTALGLAIAGWSGFDPAADSQTEFGILGLNMAISWLSTGFVFISLVLVLFIPITARRHDIIRRRLDSREAREKAFKIIGSAPVPNSVVA